MFYHSFPRRFLLLVQILLRYVDSRQTTNDEGFVLIFGGRTETALNNAHHNAVETGLSYSGGSATCWRNTMVCE